MGEKQVKVSVIMGVYNQHDKKALNLAVKSILEQTFRDLEFIIWDDGSDEQAASYIRELAQMDERILVAGKEENRGLAFSLNECIRLAKGDYIARMDADDISLSQRLWIQYEFLEQHPEYAWCGCNAFLFDNQKIWGSRCMPKEPKDRHYLKFSPFVHPTVMFRKKVFDENEGYLESEETLRCEDYEIFMRLQKAGLRGYNLQKELFCYREDSVSYRKRKWVYRRNETALRLRNFRKMGLLFPFGWAYGLRPLFGGLLPSFAIAFLKRIEGVRIGKHPGALELRREAEQRIGTAKLQPLNIRIKNAAWLIARGNKNRKDSGNGTERIRRQGADLQAFRTVSGIAFPPSPAAEGFGAESGSSGGNGPKGAGYI